MSRRNRRRGVGDRSTGGDWITPTGSFTANGTFFSSNIWNTSLQVGNVVNDPKGWFLAYIPLMTAMPAPPPLGELEIGVVAGDISLDFSLVSGSGAAVPFRFGMGIFISNQNNQAGTFDVVDPLQTADVQREDWLFLRAMNISAARQNGPALFSFPIAVPIKKKIGDGQALAFVVSGDAAGETIEVACHLRSLVRRVA